MRHTSSFPALLGGPPLRPQGPPDWPLPDPEVLAALEACYADGSWGKYTGSFCSLLEDRIRQWLGIAHVLLCSSGTSAVELALRACKVEPGDEVILAAYDFPGNFLTIHALGGIPVLADLDPLSWQLSLDSVRTALSPKTRAILASHLHGGLVPMRELLELAQSPRVRVIEDAAQCPGAWIQGRHAGTWGDVGIISFGGSKLLTAGRGGAVITAHADVMQRARLAQQRGNLTCPLSELQAAVLLPQIDKLSTRAAQRAQAVGQLHQLPALQLFGGCPLESRPDYYKVGFQYDAQTMGLPRDRFVAAVRAEGIALDTGFRALHVGRAARRFRASGPLGEADRAHNGAVILHHPILLGSSEEIQQVIQAVEKIAAHAETLRL